MRIAVLSDIHGNIWALEAALADVKAQGADLIVNAGDILSGPLEPAATADLLIGLGVPTIAGNHERQLLDCEARPGGPSDQYAFEHTTAAHRDWLRELPKTLEPVPRVFMCHGTPTSDCTNFLETIDTGGIHMADQRAVEMEAEGLAHALILCGHSHVPRVLSISQNRAVVNPGSVGLQAYDGHEPYPYAVENGSPHLRYALCEETKTGWSATLRCLSYDHGAAAKTARRNGRAEWAHWLETGRVAP